jgi:hypothetical protein
VDDRPTRAGLLLAVGLGILLSAVCFAAGGGQDLSSATTIEIVLQLLGGGTVALAVLTVPERDRLPGLLLGGLMALLAVYTALSITWAVDPSDAWIEANRTLTYFVVLAAGIALVRLAPERWAAVIGALLLASAALSAYAVASVVFPSWLSPDETVPRLRTPFGYWNSVGLAAALGVPASLWWGSRREGHGAARGLATPLLAVQLLAILLAYSRGAAVAAGIGVAVWIIYVPLRLRSAAVFLVAVIGAAAVAIWTFSQDALTTNDVPVAARDVAGHRLGLLVLAMVVLTLVASLSISFFASRRPLSPAGRRRAGIALLVLLVLVPVVIAGKLATSDRGLPGSISHSWSTLTDPHVADVANNPSRLTSIGSARASYWNDGFRIWEDHVALGAGAGGYATARPRYRTDTIQVAHAHGYVPQVLADLGVVGLAISLALVAAFLLAAHRAIGGWRTLSGPVAEHPERIGLVALATTVVVFGAHSFADWTWFVPGNAVPALLAAGWVAGRGRLARRPVGPGGGRALWTALKAGAHVPARVIVAVVIVATTLTMAWETWQPQRSVDSAEAGIEALAAGRIPQAKADIADARSENPLAIEPLFDQSAIAQREHQPAAALAALRQAVVLQPANPLAWLTLAEYQVQTGDAAGALSTMSRALFLDPRNRETQRTFLQARALLAGTGAAATAPSTTTPATPPATSKTPTPTPTPTVKGP